MSVNDETGTAANRFAAREVVVDFAPTVLRAPFFLRCGAILLDYLLMIVIPVIAMLFGRFMGNDGARLLNSEINNAAWLIAILVCLCNVVLLPMATGQSFGKIIAGLRIVTGNGEHPSAGTIALRQTCGYLLTFATLGLGFFISVFSGKGRALHDYLAGTIVIHASSRERS